MKKGTWTEKEEAFLRTNYGTLTVRDMADQLDRHHVAIAGKARALGLIKKKKAKRVKEPVVCPPQDESALAHLDPEIRALNEAYLAPKTEMPDNVKRALLWLADRLGVKITVAP